MSSKNKPPAKVALTRAVDCDDQLLGEAVRATLARAWFTFTMFTTTVLIMVGTALATGRWPLLVMAAAMVAFVAWLPLRLRKALRPHLGPGQRWRSGYQDGALRVKTPSVDVTLHRGDVSAFRRSGRIVVWRARSGRNWEVVPGDLVTDAELVELATRAKA